MTHPCPNCHHTDLHCHAVIRATLHISKDTNGSVHMSLLAWDEVVEVESYECMNCGHKFYGEEK